MNRKTSFKFTICFWILVLLCFSATAAFSIGQWHSGSVTSAPWKSKHTYIRINKVKYTVMDTTVVKNWYKKDGASYQEVTTLAKVRKGNKVNFVSEGNRIYRIEIIN